MPFAGVARSLQRTELDWPRATTRVLTNARYCAANDLLLTPTRRVVAESSSTEGVEEREAFRWRDLFAPTAERLEGRSTTIRSFRNNYYHTLVDNLPRLLLLHHPAHADRELRLLLPGGATPVESYFLERLAPPNLTRVELDPRHVYPCEEFLFPGFLSRRFSGALPAAYLEFFRDRVLPKRPRRRSQRILISRTGAADRRGIRNEEELEIALKPLGFRTWRLEELDFEDQIELFHDAAVVVAPHGAGLANLLFADDADVLELHPMPRMYPHYYFMCRALGHRYTYWCGAESERHASFRVDVGAVLGLLEKAGIG